MASTVRIVKLPEETLHANLPTLLNLDSVPQSVITIEISDILHAQGIIVLATEAAKTEAVRRCLEEDQTADCPGSYLSRHPHVHWFLDYAAASELR